MLITGDVRAFIYRDTVDMRKSIDALSYLVQPLLGQNPLSGHLFVFVAATARRSRSSTGTVPASCCGTSDSSAAAFPRWRRWPRAASRRPN